MGEAKRRNKPKPPHPKRPRLPGQAVTVPISGSNKDLSEDIIMRTKDGRFLLFTKYAISDVNSPVHREIAVVDIDTETLKPYDFTQMASLLKQQGLIMEDVTERFPQLAVLDMRTIPAMTIGEVTFKIITTPKPGKLVREEAEKKLK